VAQPELQPTIDGTGSLQKTAYKIKTSGLIDIIQARGAHLFGRGIIDNSFANSSVVHTMGCFGLRIEDVMLTRTEGDYYTCFVRGSKDVQIRGVKAMNNH
jgi:hypothetical protein